MRKTKRSTNRRRSIRRLTRKIRGGVKGKLQAILEDDKKEVLDLYNLNRVSDNKKGYFIQIIGNKGNDSHIHIYSTGAIFPGSGGKQLHYEREDTHIAVITDWLNDLEGKKIKMNSDDYDKFIDYFRNILIRLGVAPTTPAEARANERQAKHDRTRVAIEQILKFKTIDIPVEILDNVYLIVNNLLIGHTDYSTLTSAKLLCKSTIRTLKLTEPKNLDIKIDSSIHQIDELTKYVYELFHPIIQQQHGSKPNQHGSNKSRSKQSRSKQSKSAEVYEENDLDIKKQKLIDTISDIRKSKQGEEREGEEREEGKSPTMEEIYHAFRILCLIRYCNDKYKYKKIHTSFIIELILETFREFSELFSIEFKYVQLDPSRVKEIQDYINSKQRNLEALYKSAEGIQDDPANDARLEGLKERIARLSPLDQTPV